ncbi:MAG: hypothetical protein QOE68_3139, partial [Thermoanaerobaculia bacterium]|nr:hypothetical protein [Thermoanaerobaculia bacterium]
MLRVTITLLFALHFSSPLLAAGHDVSPVRYAPYGFGVTNASVAYSGNRFLTLWPMSFHIYGSLADPSGGTQAPAFPAVPFALTVVLQLTAAGSGYLAIWNQEGIPTLGTFNSAGVLERGVTLEGDRLAAARLAFNGTNVLVVSQIGAQKTIAISVYDLTGHLVKQSPLPVVIDESYAVTSIGGNFIVVTAGISGINEWRVANDGTIISTLQIQPPPLPPASSVYDVAVTAQNGRIAMAWTQFHFTRAFSAVIQPDDSIVRFALPSGLGPVTRFVAILPVDTGFLAVWNEQRSVNQPKVVAALLDGGGAPLGKGPTDIANGIFTAAASSGKAIALTLFTPDVAQMSMLIADVDTSGIAPRAPVPVTITPVRQLLPDVAGNGAGFTAAWLDFPRDSPSAVAGRVDAMGEALDGPGITVGDVDVGDVDQPATAPAIAHGSFGELMVWSAHRNLVAARLTRFGSTLDTAPIVIAPLSFPASATYSVTWNGSRFFVVWADGAQLFGAFVGPDGIATPRRPLGIQIPSFPLAPDVAWDGRQFLVVYGERASLICFGCTPWADKVRLLRVSSGGIAIDTTPLRIPGFHFRAHVASSGAESLIALDGNDISAMIVRADAGPLQLGPEIPLFHWADIFNSDVAWTGSQYVVAWRYEFVQTRPGGFFLQTRPGWIGVSKISPFGVPLGSFFAPTGGPSEISF